jgi:hypothetical protein
VKKNQLPFRQANKLRHYQSFFQQQGGDLRKRKYRRCGGKKSDSSTESDPIGSSMDGIATQNPTLHSEQLDQEFELEVVLPIDEEITNTVQPASPVDSIADKAVVVVDGETAEAHHIIDILDDLGMKFKGDGDEDVRRMKEFEERDCLEKSAWEQNQSDQ